MFRFEPLLCHIRALYRYAAAQLELNPKHPIVRGIAAARSSPDEGKRRGAVQVECSYKPQLQSAAGFNHRTYQSSEKLVSKFAFNGSTCTATKRRVARLVAEQVFDNARWGCTR